ncbi:5-hydroxytryptamine receptor 4 isoform X3 [Salminus brasiliensis]|uniref:5-hydroxytryptamine receptor 4 isoform X3 n=1 Tax=Salminus brasiliensis TaxID=930266 RepID=UPI003B834547
MRCLAKPTVEPWWAARGGGRGLIYSLVFGRGNAAPRAPLCSAVVGPESRALLCVALRFGFALLHRRRLEAGGRRGNYSASSRPQLSGYRFEKLLVCVRTGSLSHMRGCDSPREGLEPRHGVDPGTPRGNETLCFYGYMNLSSTGQMPVMEEVDTNESNGMAKRVALISFLSLVMLMSVLGNLLVMVAVCKDRQLRYYAICCQPLVYRNKMTPMRVALMIGGCWIIPTVISFLPIMQGWNSIGINHLIEARKFSGNSTLCVFMVNKPYALTCSVVAFYIPLGLMVLAYQRIYVTAREHARQISMLQRAGGAGNAASDSADHQRNHRMRTETKAAKTLCIIMGCFCLCWAPFFITNVVDPFIDYTVPEQLWAACLWLGYINSMLNPILYAFLNKSFRRAFLIILCCGHKRYRRPSILAPGAPCTATQINGSTHVLKYSVLHNGNHIEQEKLSVQNDTESQESCF